ncbi:MAG TPA: hemerythrin domain-containing protein [Gammaproteobacteria bacterium]|nr:hemerythrin domain-containing protein [Gammaproteobacteria bacterium]
MAQHKAAKGETQDALDMLREDHRNVLALFEEYEKAENARAKQQIADTVFAGLDLHARIEEELFYPTVREEIGDDDLMDEAEEEHHAIKLLMAELQEMKAGDEHYDAKFTVMCENVRHHVEEEEAEMFPKVETLDLDLMDLGEQMAELRQELIDNIDKPRAPRPGKKGGEPAASRSRNPGK